MTGFVEEKEDPCDLEKEQFQKGGAERGFFRLRRRESLEERGGNTIRRYVKRGIKKNIHPC